MGTPKEWFRQYEIVLCVFLLTRFISSFPHNKVALLFFTRWLRVCRHSQILSTQKYTTQSLDIMQIIVLLRPLSMFSLAYSCIAYISFWKIRCNLTHRFVKNKISLFIPVFSFILNPSLYLLLDWACIYSKLVLLWPSLLLLFPGWLIYQAIYFVYPVT